MAVREILKMGDPRLLRVAQPVREFGTPALRALIDDMFDTMAAASGVGPGGAADRRGSAAGDLRLRPQRALPRCARRAATVLLNPVITPLADEMEEGWEGCLSVPGLRGVVPRYTRIRYSGLRPRRARDRSRGRGLSRARGAARVRPPDRAPVPDAHARPHEAGLHQRAVSRPGRRRRRLTPVRTELSPCGKRACTRALLQRFFTLLDSCSEPARSARPWPAALKHTWTRPQMSPHRPGERQLEGAWPLGSPRCCWRSGLDRNPGAGRGRSAGPRGSGHRGAGPVLGLRHRSQRVGQPGAQPPADQRRSDRGRRRRRALNCASARPPCAWPAAASWRSAGSTTTASICSCTAAARRCACARPRWRAKSRWPPPRGGSRRAAPATSGSTVATTRASATAWSGELQFEGDDSTLTIPAGRSAEFWREGANNATHYAWGEPVRDDFADWAARANREDDRLAVARLRVARDDRLRKTSIAMGAGTRTPTTARSGRRPRWWRAGRRIATATGWSCSPGAGPGSTTRRGASRRSTTGAGSSSAAAGAGRRATVWRGRSIRRPWWPGSVVAGLRRRPWPYVGWVPLAPREPYYPHYTTGGSYWRAVNSAQMNLFPQNTPRRPPTSPTLYANQGVAGAVSVVPGNALVPRRRSRRWSRRSTRRCAAASPINLARPHVPPPRRCQTASRCRARTADRRAAARSPGTARQQRPPASRRRP